MARPDYVLQGGKNGVAFRRAHLKEPPRARFPCWTAKDGGDFDMRGKAELVKRRHGLDAKSAVDEDARVAREGRGVARDGRDQRQGGGGERARLLERARARRIDERRVEGGEFVGSQRAAE